MTIITTFPVAVDGCVIVIEDALTAVTRGEALAPTRAAVAGVTDHAIVFEANV